MTMSNWTISRRIITGFVTMVLIAVALGGFALWRLTGLAQSIAEQLERRVAFRRAMKQSVQRAMRFGAKGVRVQVAGRLGGAEMSRREWEREGRVKKTTAAAPKAATARPSERLATTNLSLTPFTLLSVQNPLQYARSPRAELPAIAK